MSIIVGSLFEYSKYEFTFKKNYLRKLLDIATEDLL